MPARGVTLLLWCVVASAVAAAIFPLVAALLAPIVRVQLTEVGLGTGPKLFERQVGTAKVKVCLLPLSSWVMAAGQSHYADEATDRAKLRPGRVMWGESSAALRVLAFVLAPRLVTLGLACVVGPMRALDSTGRGIVQVVTGALGPLSTARAILEGGAAILAQEGVLVIVALALTKWLAFGLLSLPGDLAGALDRGAASPSKTIVKVRAVLMIVLLAVMISWTVAWVAFLIRGVR